MDQFVDGHEYILGCIKNYAKTKSCQPTYVIVKSHFEELKVDFLTLCQAVVNIGYNIQSKYKKNTNILIDIENETNFIYCILGVICAGCNPVLIGKNIHNKNTLPKLLNSFPDLGCIISIAEIIEAGVKVEMYEQLISGNTNPDSFSSTNIDGGVNIFIIGNNYNIQSVPLNQLNAQYQNIMKSFQYKSTYRIVNAITCKNPFEYFNGLLLTIYTGLTTYLIGREDCLEDETLLLKVTSRYRSEVVLVNSNNIEKCLKVNQMDILNQIDLSSLKTVIMNTTLDLSENLITLCNNFCIDKNNLIIHKNILLNNFSEIFDSIKNCLDKNNVFVFTISGDDQTELMRNVEATINYCNKNNEIGLKEICSESLQYFSSKKYRKAFVVSSIEELIENLSMFDSKLTDNSKDKKIAFVFTGQGCQCTHMDYTLYNLYPNFKNNVDKCIDLFYQIGNIDLQNFLFNNDDNFDVNLLLPALFTVEYSLSALIISWGIKPNAVLGHSDGEYAAMVTAGIIELEDAVKIIVNRNRYLSSLPDKGVMVAVKCDEAASREMILNWNLNIDIAAINSFDQTVLAGNELEVNKLLQKCKEKSIKTTILEIPFAFHSHLMDTIVSPFASDCKDIKLLEPSIPYISGLKGKKIGVEINNDYFSDLLRRKVLFSDGIRALEDHGIDNFIEIGPDLLLKNTIERNLTNPNSTVVGTLQRKKDDFREILNSLCVLYEKGFDPCWEIIFSNIKSDHFVSAVKMYVFQNSSSINNINIPSINKELFLSGKIRKMCSELTGESVNEINTEKPIFEMGFNSISLHELVVLIHSISGVELSFDVFDEYCSINVLLNIVRNKLNSVDNSVTNNNNFTQYYKKQSDKENHTPFSLSEIQQAYLIGRSSDSESEGVACHVCYEFETENLEIEKLEVSWNKCINRHSMLRAVIDESGQQYILEHFPYYKIEMIDLTSLHEEDKVKRLQGEREKIENQIMSLNKWPLFYIGVRKLSDHKMHVVIDFDMLICDFASMFILFNEWKYFYLNPIGELPEINLTFREYLSSEEKLKKSEKYQQSFNYWKNRMGSLPMAPNLPVNSRFSENMKPVFKRRIGCLSRNNWQRVKENLQKLGLTPSVFLLGIFSDVLSKWCSDPKFTLNVTIFNRYPFHDHVNKIVGDFTSVNLLEFDSGKDISFTEYCKSIQKQLFQDLKNKHVSGITILREIKKASQNYSMLMPIVFTSTLGLDSIYDGEMQTEWLGKKIYSLTQTPQVWLDCQVSENKGDLIFNWDSVDDRYPECMIDDMFQTYEKYIQIFSENIMDWKFNTEIDIPECQLQTRIKINETQGDVSSKMLHTLFDESAARFPDYPAIITSNEKIIYRDLEKMSNALAVQIRNFGVKANELIGISIKKSWVQIASVLAVLKSGGAYLPLELSWPSDRVRNILQQANVRLLLIESTNTNGDQYQNVTLLHADTFFTNITEKSSRLNNIQKNTDLAYVIFTSGSTGVPKGVMIDHQGAVNTILDINQKYGISSIDRTLALSSLSFDLSVYDIFGMFAAGGAIVIPDPEFSKDPGHWHTLIKDTNVTVWNSVPAIMEMYTEYMEGRNIRISESLSHVLMSGDWIPVNLPERIKSLKKDIQTISLGGATEASIWSIYFNINKVDSSWKSIPYGTPLKNQTFYCLNAKLNEVPDWVTGDLYIGGIGVAKGYYGDAEKTHERFINHPITGEKIYWTGDKGRYMKEGVLEFLGRDDLQIKINGFRIELGDIEAALYKNSNIKNCIALATKDSSQERRLAVCYSTFNGLEITKNEIHSFLSNLLPEYMVPSKYIHLDTLPLSANGKVDRKGISSIVEKQTSEISKINSSNRIITDINEKLTFKLKKVSVRKDLSGDEIILNRPVINEHELKKFTERKSYRSFCKDKISKDNFSKFIGSLRQESISGYPITKAAYSSAGGLYPVQVYIYVKENCIEEIESGLYYYQPVEYKLLRIPGNAKINSESFTGANSAIFSSSAFVIFLIADMRAIKPLYGDWARDFCLIESGIIAHHLESNAPVNDIGLCQIGMFEFNNIATFFPINEDHMYLHCLVGGGIFENQKTSENLAEDANELKIMIESLNFNNQNNMLSDKNTIEKKSLNLDVSFYSECKSVVNKQLPPSIVSNFTTPVVANATEEKLLGIWKDILNLETIGLTDNFFDLGGTSFKVVEMSSRIKKELNADISVVQLFRYTNIRSLAAFIDEGDTGKKKVVDKLAKRAQAQSIAKRNMETGRIKGDLT